MSRALRRHHRERILRREFNRQLKFNYWREPVPHLYHAYNLDDPDDFLAFLAEDIEQRNRKIYVIGKGHKGCINPSLPWTNWNGQEESACISPPYDWEEVYEQAMDSARRMVNTRPAFSCWCCGNPRRWHKQKTLKEQFAYLDAKKEFEEYGINLPRKNIQHGW